MSGIISYGAYVPYYRLSRGDIFTTWFGQVMPFPGEKAVANFDEDSCTMAVAAGIDCLADLDREEIDGLYFASTSSPYSSLTASCFARNSSSLRTSSSDPYSVAETQTSFVTYSDAASSMSFEALSSSCAGALA